MTFVGWLRSVYALAIALLTTHRRVHVPRFEGERQPFARVTIERALYRLYGVDPRAEQT
jgi:hypothetical protein